MLSEKWRIKLLNGIEVTGSGKRLDRFRGRTSAELLALLVLNSHRGVSREEIAGTIWPESSAEAGRAGSRTALASLRSQLEPPGTIANTVFLADRTSVRFIQDAFTADVLDYNSLCDRAESARSSEDRLAAATQAVELYTGEFLPGIYSEWVLVEREKLNNSYRKQLANIVSLHRSAGKPSLAIPYAIRLIDEDPYVEEPYLSTMRLYIEAGNREEALRCFMRLSKTLKSEFGAEPSVAAGELERFAIQLPSANSTTLIRNNSVKAAALYSTDSARKTLDYEDSNARATRRASPKCTGLPISLTQFFGRDTDIMHIVRMFCPEPAAGILAMAPQRLITVTGTGGTGKTRMATEIGTILNVDRKLPVTFVPLADIDDPARMLDAIASALKLGASDVDDIFDRVVSALTGEPNLLILDNLEQLLAPTPVHVIGIEPVAITTDCLAAGIVQALLENVPSLSCLVTSRQSLGIEGEQEYPLQPLATPALTATPERLLDFASVKLFVDRAQLSRPDFQLTPRNADVVGSICAKLDGLPLALELAAAWSSSLSPSQILERLALRFELLVGRRRGRAARHASLRAALEWSFHLLGSNQQEMFSRLSVFRGGWNLQAAEFVCTDPDALETLRALQNRSLIVLEELPDGSVDLLRYRFLESLREYSAEQLSGVDTVAVQRRHLEWYAGWTNEARPHWSGRDQELWLQRVQLEQENIRAALEFSLNDADSTSARTGMRIMANLGHYWSLRGNITDVRDLFKRFLEHASTHEPNMERAEALMEAGSLASFQEDWILAGELYKQSLTITRICEPQRVGSAQLSLGNVAFQSGDLESARRYYRDGLVSYEGAGSPVGIAAAYGALGEIAMADGDYDTAIDSARKAVDLNRAQNNLSGVTHHLKQLALCYSKCGQQAEAYSCLAESLEGYYSLKDLRGIAELFTEALDVIPLTSESVCLLGAAQTLNVIISARPRPNQELVDLCRSGLGNRAFDEAWERGRALSTDQTVELARQLFSPERALSTVAL